VLGLYKRESYFSGISVRKHCLSLLMSEIREEEVVDFNLNLDFEKKSLLIGSVSSFPE